MRSPRTPPAAVVSAKADDYFRDQEDRLAGSTSPARHVSIKRLSELTGFDRLTIRNWLDEGCPVVSRGARGDDYVLDIRAVWKWREQRAVDKALGSRSSDPDGGAAASFMGLRDPLKIEDLKIKRMKSEELAKRLVPRKYVVATVARVLNQVRVSVMSIPDRLHREMSGFPDDKAIKWREEAQKTCRSALQQAADGIEMAMTDLKDPDEGDGADDS